MNGNSYSIRAGMIFGKFHCAKCATKLVREKTHRVVTKDDWDYYRYHSLNKFPRRDYDVYDYRFKCPSCNARISYDEQCIIKRIQKKNKSLILSSSEIKKDYKQFKEKHGKSVLIKRILYGIILLLIGYVLAVNSDNNVKNTALLFLGIVAYLVISCIRQHKGKGIFKYTASHSFEQESQFEKLHTFSSNNKEIVDISEKCYCFFCQSCIDPREIKNYADNGQTALCPNCNMKTILPDGIEEKVDGKIIAQMHEYWF